MNVLYSDFIWILFLVLFLHYVTRTLYDCLSNPYGLGILVRDSVLWGVPVCSWCSVVNLGSLVCFLRNCWSVVIILWQFGFRESLVVFHSLERAGWAQRFRNGLKHRCVDCRVYLPFFLLHPNILPRIASSLYSLCVASLRCVRACFLEMYRRR